MAGTEFVRLDDQTLLLLYTRFQRERRSLGKVYPQATYDDFIDGGRYLGTALPVLLIAQDHLLEVTNTVNRFLYNLCSLSAWNKVFISLTEDERTQALLEFVLPLTSLLLSAPYSIKQMFSASIYQISFYTNRLCNGGKDPLNPKVNFKDAEKSAKAFSSWPALSVALSQLNSASFINASDDYRRRHNHGFPRSVELGHRFVVNPTNADQTEYEIREEGPLQIDMLIPLIEEQYRAAITAHTTYVDLIKEQEKLWPHG